MSATPTSPSHIPIKDGMSPDSALSDLAGRQSANPGNRIRATDGSDSPTGSSFTDDMETLSESRTQTPDPRPTSPRVVAPTGFRRGVKSSNLLGPKAPTQLRKYKTPSATARRDLPPVEPPTVVGAKRGRDDEPSPSPVTKRGKSTVNATNDTSNLDDSLESERPVVKPTAKQRAQIERRRLQNTLAARRSSKRKFELKENLEAEIEHQKDRARKAELALAETLEEIAALKGALNRKMLERERTEQEQGLCSG